MTAMPPSMSDRDGKIWMDGQMVEWRDAKIHVLTHTQWGSVGASMSSEVLAGFERVNRAAVRALGGATASHIQIDLWMGVPGLHVRQRAGAENATLVVQVLGRQLNGGGLGFLLHVVFLISGSVWFWLSCDFTALSGGQS